MQKWWSLLFGVVLAATFILWLISPAMGWWLPANVSTFGPDVDYLFYVILGFTGFFFVLTEGLLVYAMYRWAFRPGHKATYVHGNHRLELAWTIVPALILLFIAFAQVTAWERIKYQSRFPHPDQILQVGARQWEWRLRYPENAATFGQDKDPDQKAARQWAEVPQIDDLHLVNELHTWFDPDTRKGANVKIFLKTQDVLHSLYFPNLRLKQDALPGKTIPMWFQATGWNTEFDPATGLCSEPKDKIWELACAELCGSRHYAMRGRLFVHKGKADYEAWLKHALELQRSRKPEPSRQQPGSGDGVAVNTNN
ncbi:MAG TPA: cytochrome c oxidase subunit II transmembrane domain-containing protein [Gemmataceae bacterium]|nr:cytochrome c oxidase subunit II transmembrane domain-containing protein [Gemmataceae bacterium]